MYDEMVLKSNLKELNKQRWLLSFKVFEDGGEASVLVSGCEGRRCLFC